MNFWLLDSMSRLKDFRDFRVGLSEENNLEVKLQMIVDKWKLVPISTRIIDPYSPHTWPTPWELLHENNYDENCVAVIIFHILNMIDIESKILLVEHKEKTFLKLIILVDDNYVLNYSYGNVESKSELKNCNILEIWEKSDITG